MPFVQGKCENCGGILTVDPNLKAANCPFCGVAYVVQDSINYFNTTIKVDTLHADVVNMSDEHSSEGRLKAADAHMKLGHYDKAEVEYKKVTELAPQNYRGWLGLIEVYTQKYSKRIKSANEIKNLTTYAKNIDIVTTDEERKDALKKYSEYIISETTKNTNELDNYSRLISHQNEIIDNLSKQKKALEASIEQTKKDLSISGGTTAGLITSIIFIVIGSSCAYLAVMGSVIAVLQKYGGIEFAGAEDSASPDTLLIGGAILGGFGLLFLIAGILMKKSVKSEQVKIATLKEKLKMPSIQIEEINKEMEEISCKINSYQLEMKKYD